TYAERDWLKSSGYAIPRLKKAWRAVKEAASSLFAKFRKPEQKPGQKEPGVDEYLLGTKFFGAVSERVGVARAFNLISSNLPRDMTEIEYPNTYIHRVVSEYGLQN
ncbi:MAG TPA: hypothetical protein PKJ97_03500, partial [Candidatus Bilamarchaeaceae archaeon]|nr:hypothetical protein [Candidatus Bilamarchaeaceae archaeon]